MSPEQGSSREGRARAVESDLALNAGSVRTGPRALHKLLTLWDLSLGFSKPGIMMPAGLSCRLERRDVK